MTVKRIFKLIKLNDNVAIIGHKTQIKYWSGRGKDIPLRYSNNEVKHIYSEPLYNDDASEIIIAINE